MTLDQAIDHCEEIAERCSINDNMVCGLEHRQLAEWLRELKERRRNSNFCNDCQEFDCYGCWVKEKEK